MRQLQKQRLKSSNQRTLKKPQETAGEGGAEKNSDERNKRIWKRGVVSSVNKAHDEGRLEGMEKSE